MCIRGWRDGSLPLSGHCARALVQRTTRAKEWVMLFGFSYNFTFDLPCFYLMLEIRKYWVLFSYNEYPHFLYIMWPQHRMCNSKSESNEVYGAYCMLQACTCVFFLWKKVGRLQKLTSLFSLLLLLLLDCWFWRQGLTSGPSWPQTLYVDQDGLKLMALFPLPP